jgi:hypothetical protein
MLEPEGLVVRDATMDPRFADTPLLTGHTLPRGLPRVSAGLQTGSLCVIDTTPYEAGLSERQRFALKRLANPDRHRDLATPGPCRAWSGRYAAAPDPRKPH